MHVLLHDFLLLTKKKKKKKKKRKKEKKKMERNFTKLARYFKQYLRAVLEDTF